MNVYCPEVGVYLGCLNFVVNFYSAFALLHGITSHFIALMLVSFAFFGILLRYHVPRPKASFTQSYFGKEWGAYASYKNVTEEDGFVLKVVAHRACGLDSPENSLAALKAIHREGIKVVEFDVMLTSDGIPVVFHDVDLTRMADLNENVSNVTFEEIRKIDISVKHPFGKNFRGEKIPTLYEYVTYCLENGIRMIIDLKTGNDKTVQIITDLYKQYPNMYELSLVSSFNALVVYKIRAKDPNIICSLAWRPYFFSHEEYNVARGPLRPRRKNLVVQAVLQFLNICYQWALWKFGYYLLGLSALLLHKDMITRDIIQYWNKRGIRVIAWNVNLPTEKQYFEKILAITYLTDTVINS